MNFLSPKRPEMERSIPLIDLRSGSPIDLVRDHADTARSLIHAATNQFGIISRVASQLVLPSADRKCRAWLVRTGNPYLAEIDAIASLLGVPGAYALNLSYEWGCTSGAFSHGETVTLMRLLDWPFPDIGKKVMVLFQSGQAGDFYNVGWPGMCGMLNGMAPGRFAATLNQAPMRKHGLTVTGDWVRNRMDVYQAGGLPPAHLLRMAFEQAPDYAAAKEMLITTPVALPVIFIVSGVRPGEGCVIERTETAAQVAELGTSDRITAVNHFTSPAHPPAEWRPRTKNSPERYLQSCKMQLDGLQRDDFHWASPPMIHALTRLGVLADASQGRLVVQGIEGNLPVTKVFTLQGQDV